MNFNYNTSLSTKKYINPLKDKEIVDDEILNQILLMTEYFSLLGKKDFLSLYTQEDVENSLKFLNEKIKKLEEYQRVFNLKPVLNRFEQVNKYLDTITLEEYYPNFVEHFSTDVSLILDILYSTVTQVQNILDYFLMQDLQDLKDKK